MCGIAGWVDFARELGPEAGATGAAMAGTLACRGPDAEGRWYDRHAMLLHRRLSVIDPRGGAQPMAASLGGGHTAVLTFCGEIYNYRELRAELAGHGHRFRTASDTEVLLRAYLRWGEHCAERLNGMYAFGVWDSRGDRLLLARDRMGVKPLYYFPTPDGLLFGSEPKAILAAPHVPRRVDADGLREILDMVRTPGRAVYAGMREVPPGALVIRDRRGLRTRRYWSLPAREHEDDHAATVRTVRELLEDIVSRQLVADVPLCALLSGGLDSSAVTALAARSLRASGRGPVRSFSVDFAGAGRDFAPDAVRGAPDAPFVRDLAAHVGADHTEVLLDSADLAAPGVRAAVLRATDAPPAYWGDMWPSLYLLFREIRQHSTVALSGEAADELFGGYRWFHHPAAVNAPTFPWLTSGSARYFGGLTLLDRDLVAKLDLPEHRRAAYGEALAAVPRLPGETGLERRMREVTHLNLTRFVQTLLDRKDRMSMAVGLEARVPYCDHRLVEYVFNVPWAMKAADGREKSLLRAAVADLLPPSILQRVKTPYPAIQDPAYERALRAELAEVLADGDAPVRPLLDLGRARVALARPPRAASLPYDRGGLEMALWLNRWLAEYDVTLDL
ncbi:asparagine synthase (glutamine-hydrolyzing) [Bailinhaonella thermotolerans]|uniref:asparagine synthase (glutamine-hydrolyzing) n=1 Tax=Bailinhaonella thermotolerans TaxID=1070861 RepID=A0A3A4BCP7_9ACTN|nr:asparagine synthase (glutamine-hydrolyzing) [Bailinhaonella thermotolerans]RJL35876.1 asparagine synthase (glutamine-hydrolyzing) [Bailinhaonella thermotolerans]